MKKRATTMFEYFAPKKTSTRRTQSTSISPPPPPYPLIDSRRKENDFTTFVTSSDSDYPDALYEIQTGRKTSHWIWYILPQLASLGSSPQAIWYGIKSFPEAQQYLNHPILGVRLLEICEVINEKLTISKIPIRTLMGGGIDAMKLLSSMTLFYFASYQTNNEILFTNLRILCEQKLKRQDDKTILFCEESMDRLRLPIPVSHQDVTFDIKKTPPSSQSSEMMDVVASEPSPSSYPLLSSTRLENDFTLFYRYSPARYHRSLDELQSKDEANRTFSPWLWFLLPSLVSIPEESPNAFYFGIKSFPEGQKFYQDEILGFQIFELFGVICLRLEDEQHKEGEDKDEEDEKKEESKKGLEKVMLSRENISKLLSSVTLFSFVNETISDNSLPYLHRVNSLKIMEKKDFQTLRDLLLFLRKKCEDSLQQIDKRTIEFCEESINFLKSQREAEVAREEKNSESVSKSDEVMQQQNTSSGSHEESESSEPKCGETGADEETRSEATDVEVKAEGKEQEEYTEHDDDEKGNSDEKEEEHEEECVDSVDSQSHEYNEYTYQLEVMELQTPPEGVDQDQDEDLP
jgi:uncharacterized protein (DUF1810 family)